MQIVTSVVSLYSKGMIHPNALLASDKEVSSLKCTESVEGKINTVTCTNAALVFQVIVSHQWVKKKKMAKEQSMKNAQT